MSQKSVLFFLVYNRASMNFIYKLGKEVAMTLDQPKGQNLYSAIKMVVIL